MIEETKISLVCLFPKFSPSSLVEGVSEVSALLGFCFGEGSGTPLQYSCLESPMDGGAWWATAYEITESGMTEATAHAGRAGAKQKPAAAAAKSFSHV